MPAKKVHPTMRASLKAVRENFDRPPLSLGLAEDEPAPPWLPEVGRQEWRRVLEVSRTRPRWLTLVDAETLAGYCATVAVFRQAVEDVNARGHLVPGRSSADSVRPDGAGVVKNPSVAVMMAAASSLRAFATALGFSPAARQGLALGPTEDPDADSLFDLGDGSPWT